LRKSFIDIQLGAVGDIRGTAFGQTIDDATP
jgi:hypothetical protein